ncbi:hypothetical protein [Nocardia abscessus]|uniref:hypothetical protein n=1 Tax=Nocardia abscessus TaxID=120957 RepID=UPI0024540503|nr:hypothetical protein [Nocardia abscessus]
MATELDVTQAFLDSAVAAHAQGSLTDIDAAEAKWWTADVNDRSQPRLLARSRR